MDFYINGKQSRLGQFGSGNKIKTVVLKTWSVKFRL